jgi:predicted ester cyclase
MEVTFYLASTPKSDRFHKSRLKGEHTMSTEELKATIRRVWDEAWNKGNPDALDELYAADYVRHRAPFPDFEGLEAYKQFVAETRISYPDCQLTLHEIIIEGDISAARWTWSGTQTGPSPSTGAPPTGKHGVLAGCSVVRWVEGKCVEEWEGADYLGLFQQLGIIPPLGQGEE